MTIPVMHDDQHGTAIISGAALLNALEIIDKKIEDIKLVVNGAGAAAISCTFFYMSLGVKKENIVICDKEGVVRADREDMEVNRQALATHRDIHTLTEAMTGADVFLGLSAANTVTQDQVRLMARDPLVFALANPDPEISYELATTAREDLIMATGRSDYPNQVNNVIGFPYIFRGAMDVRATAINEEMKLAAAKAIAKLAKESVPDIVNKAYGDSKLGFGRDYLIPKPLDPRLITTIAPAVAKAAMESGVARQPITDWDSYELELQERIGIDQRLMSRVISRAKKDPKRVVFAEADNRRILKAAQLIQDEKIGIPILLGNRAKIQALIEEHSLDLREATIIDPFEEDEKLEIYGQELYEKRKRKGIIPFEAKKLMRDRNYFGAMMVELGDADALISGLTKDYPRTILPALHVIGVQEGVDRVAGMYIMNSNKGPYFFADTTVNVNPTADQLVGIIGLTAKGFNVFHLEPRIADLSYYKFGTAKGHRPTKTAHATTKAKAKYPHLVIEEEMQAKVALDEKLQTEHYPS